MPTLYLARRVEINGKVHGPHAQVDIKDDKLAQLLCKNGVAQIVTVTPTAAPDAPKKESK